MEYLFEKPSYKRRPNEGNGRIYTVQLTKNYRSHPDILSIPNELFYEGSLEAKPTGIKVLTTIFFKNILFIYDICNTYENFNFSLEISNWFIETKLLLNKALPIIFDSLKGNCKKIDLSYYNEEEVNATEKWIKELLSMEWNGQFVTVENIGIISPYKAQINELKTMCKRNAWDKLKTGSVEVFQGKYGFRSNFVKISSIHILIQEILIIIIN